MRASDDSRLVAALVWLHRWVGVATCLIFAMWFATGAVMVFKPFPSMGTEERLAIAAPLQLDRVEIAPGEALRSAGAEPTAGLRLIQRGGTPVYVIEGTGGTRVLDAETGRLLPQLTATQVGAVGNPIDYDQWIVPNGIDPFRPVFRIPRGDAAGSVLYVSALTGESVQRTTSSTRAWNWLGSVLHWVYFTPLRSNWAAWDQTVWWLSFVAMFVAVLGIVLGILRTLRALSQPRPTLTYFRIWWMRWHHLLGLFAGLFVLTWILSGWLSMDHGRLFSRGQATAAQVSAYTGKPAYDAVTATTLNRVDLAKEVSFFSLAGSPVLSIVRPDGTSERLDEKGHSISDAAFFQRVSAGVHAAWPGASLGSLEAVHSNDLLRLNEGWPAAVRRAHLTGGRFPDLYIDSSTGELLTVMDRSRVAYAWAYYALHTLKFPGLVEHDGARKVLELILLAAGFAFSVTGIVIAWRRIRPKRGNHGGETARKDYQ